MAPGRPLIGIPLTGAWSVITHSHGGEKYARAVLDAAGGVPLFIPRWRRNWLDELIERLTGCFLRQPSNVEPYSTRAPERPGTLPIRKRDATTPPLIRGGERPAGVRDPPRLPG
jgi:hypothetical protein